jgi:hypothetical protein
MMIKIDKPYQYYGKETGSRQGEIVAKAICQNKLNIQKLLRYTKVSPKAF